MNKYGAIRTEYDGRVYDSKAEANRAAVLALAQRAGNIVWWIPQVTIQLGPDSKYRVDFLVGEPSGYGGLVSVHAEDVKGVRTPAFERNIRLWRKYGPFPLRVIEGPNLQVVYKLNEQNHV